jgi:hypothetical protein
MYINILFYSKITDVIYKIITIFTFFQIIIQFLGPRWFELASGLKRCILNKFNFVTPAEFWSEINHISEECGSDLVKNLLHARYLVNKVNDKNTIEFYFIFINQNLFNVNSKKIIN